MPRVLREPTGGARTELDGRIPGQNGSSKMYGRNLKTGIGPSQIEIRGDRNISINS